MGEDSDLEIILEDEISEDHDISVSQTGKRATITHSINGGINDSYWTKCRQLFLPTMGLDGALSIEETISASIALLFEVDELIYSGSLFDRLQGAVVSGSSVLTREHLGNKSKRTAYYALTTMHGYGLFPRGFVYLCINLLGSDKAEMRKAVEPLKKLNGAMKGQLTYISKCREKRVGKNKELHEKCVKMQEMVDRLILPQYPLIFERGREKWPPIVQSAVRDHEEGANKKVPNEEWMKRNEKNYSNERHEKVRGKMANLHLTPFWITNTRIWGLTNEVDGEKVVETAIKFIKELNSKLYGGRLLEKIRAICGKALPLDETNVYDNTRQHSLRFLEIIERYAVIPRGILALLIKAIMHDESTLGPIVDLLGKIAKPAENNIDNMVELAAHCSNGKTAEKDAQIAPILANLRTMAQNEIYPLLPSVFAPLKCTRVPSYVTEWMKKSPITKSGVKEWSWKMGVETDLNGFPLRINEDFVMPEMADEFMVEEVKKKREKKRGKDGKEDKIVPMKKEKRDISSVHSKTKPVSLMDQVISNPFGYPRMIPPPPLPHPAIPLLPPFGPPAMFGPPPMMGLIGTETRLPFMGGPPPLLMGVGGRRMDTPLMIESPTGAETNEERRKLEKMAKLMIGGVEKRREDESESLMKMERRDEEEMNERERRLQRWLEEKNGRRRKESSREQRRGRSRSRSRERERDDRGDFERRVEELERKKKEEMEEKERSIKEVCVEHWRKVKGSFKPMDECKWEFRPEWGVTTVWRRVSGHSRWEEKVKDKLDHLSKTIEEHFLRNVQTPEDEQRKKIVLERLQDGMQMKLESTGVFFLMAGSTPSSFASKNSNLDLVLISPEPAMTPEQIRDLFFHDLPYIIMQRGGTITRQEALWMEFECTMAGNRLGVRIAIDSGAYYFSKIMAIYDSIDRRVSALLHYIKHWTATHLRRADDISKYLLTNLVIHYLQSGVSPPVLPCLHILYPARLAPDIFSSFDYASPFDPPLPDRMNKQSLASLFIGFLMYFASFDFSRYAISIRAGTVIRKRDLGGIVPEFAVEHPFDGTYSAVVNDPFTSSHFAAAMTAACQDAITALRI